MFSQPCIRGCLLGYTAPSLGNRIATVRNNVVSSLQGSMGVSRTDSSKFNISVMGFVIALLNRNIKGSVVNAYSSGLHVCHLYQDPIHFGLWYILPNGTYTAVLTEASTDEHSINNVYCMYCIYIYGRLNGLVTFCVDTAFYNRLLMEI